MGRHFVRFRTSLAVVRTCQFTVTMPRRPVPPASATVTPEPAEPLFQGDSDEDEDQLDQPAVLISPVKARAVKQGTANKADAEVWNLPDNEIIGEWLFCSQYGAYSCFLEASKSTWRSSAYDHFDTTLRRDLDRKGQPLSLSFVFTCKIDPLHHPPHIRARKSSAQGTKNLHDGIKACNNRTGTTTADAAVQPTGEPYSPAAHRTLIAMRCAKNHRPFNSVSDEDYQAEVEMLRPGTVLPAPSTVSRDIKAIYLSMSIMVRTYFAVCYKLLVA
jgi:hypothetical protein